MQNRAAPNHVFGSSLPVSPSWNLWKTVGAVGQSVSHTNTHTAQTLSTLPSFHQQLSQLGTQRKEGGEEEEEEGGKEGGKKRCKVCGGGGLGGEEEAGDDKKREGKGARGEERLLSSILYKCERWTDKRKRVEGRKGGGGEEMKRRAGGEKVTKRGRERTNEEDEGRKAGGERKLIKENETK